MAATALLLLPASSLPAAAAVLKSATYCRALEENQAPKDKTDSFSPDEKVCLSIELKGRPKSGVVAAKFIYRGHEITETKLDVAEVNKGVIFSFGQNTFVGFTLKPTSPMPVGTGYQTDVTFDGAPLGSFPWSVAAPKNAIPSKVASVVLARDIDEKKGPIGETREFTPAQKVVLAGRGDLGNASWIEVNWLVAGKLDPAGTRSFTIEENKKNVPFYFSFAPKGGWPEGAHEVVLMLDGREAAREKFNVKPGPDMGASRATVTLTSLYHDDGKGGRGEPAKFFGTDERIFHVEFSLAAPSRVQGIRIAWRLVEAAAAQPQEIAVASVQEEGAQNSLTGLLRTKKGLPPGRYRVALLQGDKEVLASEEFEVKTAAGDTPPRPGSKRKP